MVRWEPWRKPRGGVAAPKQRHGIVRRIARGRYDAYIRRWAGDARRYGKPLIIRLMHEMNGSWYPWSVNTNGNSPAAFRAAWRRVHRIFRLAGAKNVSWVFSVDSFAGGRPTPRGQVDQFYPGSSFVDWVGLSGFNWARSRYGGVLSFDRVFRPTYEIVKHYGKPLMLAETGTAARNTRTAAAWVRDAMTSTPRRFPRVKALVWFDSPHPKRDFTLHGRALREFRANARRPTMRPPLRLVTR
jgi:mannan endo-1,4-beta-mannosidase